MLMGPQAAQALHSGISQVGCVHLCGDAVLVHFP